MEPCSLPKEAAARRTRQPQQKPKTFFGYLPLYSECIPLDNQDGNPNLPAVLANVSAGLLIGVREALGGIVSAGLLFSSSESRELREMFPLGICMMWYTLAFTCIWYAAFGRLQYAYGTAQDVVGILQASILSRMAVNLTASGKSDKVQGTALAIISMSAILTGLCSFVLGKLSLGRYMLAFPTPVTSGFLGSIGFVILRTSLQMSSGVRFEYAYPVDVAAFCSYRSLQRVACQIAMVCCIRLGRPLLRRLLGKNGILDQLSTLFCQIFPLFVFYSWVFWSGLTMDELTANDWTYPEEHGSGVKALWTRYSLFDADKNAVLAHLPEVTQVVMLAVMCTMTGVLGITGKFPTGPPGDPSPCELIDFDKELTTIGISSLLLGLSRGTLSFQTFTAIQLRLDGGTHRVSVLSMAVLAAFLLVSGIPLGHYIPKWYLSGLFMNTAVHFLGDAVLSYRTLPPAPWMILGFEIPSPQYSITVGCIVVAAFTTPFRAIQVGLLLSGIMFLMDSAERACVSNVLMGDRVVSRTQRPVWEMRTLRAEGDRIMLLYLQGSLFFGSVQRLARALAAASASERITFCILSFARVQMLDPSAARHLKVAVDRARRGGCQVVYCRMNPRVRAAMVAVKSINHEVARVGLSSRAKSSDGIMGRSATDALLPKWTSQEEILTASQAVEFYAVERRRKESAVQHDQAGPGDEEGQYFKQETDALDHCADMLVQDYFYMSQCTDTMVQPVEPYMLVYHKAYAQGDRLPEWCFEMMNRMPKGIMARLRPFCKIWSDLQPAECIPQAAEECPLFFILQGGASVVELLPEAEGARESRVDGHFKDAVRGFSFYPGKRLHKRYPVGRVLGQAFFLKLAGHVIDAERVPQVFVSARLSQSVEIWSLGIEAWADLPEELRQMLMNTLCCQMAEDIQHLQLQER